MTHHNVYAEKPTDGIDDLPDVPGIYCILNRVTGKRNVGQTRNSQRKRAKSHRSAMKRGDPPTMLMYRDLLAHGYESFVFFSLFSIDERVSNRPTRQSVLNTELHWGKLLGSHVEPMGYNLDLGGRRTVGARFRDQERKLMRSRSCKYELLPGVDLYDAVSSTLTDTWVSGR